MKIYTKTGDKGQTSLYDGSRVDKSNSIIETLGNIDELNCEIGCILAHCINYDNDEIKILEKVQNWLFDIGTIIAMPKNKDSTEIIFDKNEEYTLQLETLIDLMTNKLPKLKNFILPGGNIIIANIHKSRAICRRAERSIVLLANNNNYIKINCIKFINRLSDYLFTLARYVAFINNVPEIIYKK